MNRGKKKQDEPIQDNNQKCGGHSCEEEVNQKQGINIMKIIGIVILTIIVILGVLTFSFCLNFRVITGDAISNILFWKMAN